MTCARFIHTADLHLSRPFGFLPPQLAEERRRDQRRTLARIVDLALEREVDLVLLSGDLFDSFDPDPTDLESVTREFSRLSESRVRIFAIPGNHDYISPGSFWNHLEVAGLHIFRQTEWETIILEDLGVSISGIAFHRTKSERRAFEDLHLNEEIPSIVMVHASYEQFEGQLDRYHPFCASEVSASGASYIALGHYHRFSSFSESGTIACYPGTPEGLSFDPVETEDRQVVIGEIEDNSAVRIEPVRINRRVMRSTEIDCTPFDSRTSFFDAVRRICDVNTLVRFKPVGTPIADIDQAIKEISDRFGDSCLYLTVDSSDISMPSDLQACDLTIRGRFYRHLLTEIEETTDPERRRLLRRALDLGLAAFTER